MNKYLIKLANHLDKKGLHKEADYVDWIIKNAETQTQSLSSDFDNNKKILDAIRDRRREGFTTHIIFGSPYAVNKISEKLNKNFGSGQYFKTTSGRFIERTAKGVPYKDSSEFAKQIKAIIDAGFEAPYVSTVGVPAKK